MRAANVLKEKQAHAGLFWVRDLTLIEVAAIIDAEMGLPELIEALKNIEINAAAPGIWHEWHKGVVLRLVRSALARAEGK
jgi:hypothetical protein